MGVLKTDGGEGVAGEGVGLRHVGRAGEAGADAVGEGSGKLHDVGVVEAFVTNAGVHVEVYILDGGLGTVEGGLFFVSGVKRSEKREDGGGTEAPALNGERK